MSIECLRHLESQLTMMKIAKRAMKAVPIAIAEVHGAVAAAEAVAQVHAFNHIFHHAELM